ncbi:MAG: PhzF family phenazine biosynthesis protein [Edaphobacter sp.]
MITLGEQTKARFTITTLYLQRSRIYKDPVLPSSIAHARFFNPTVGIVEDSATGTAAGPLPCLLASHGIVDDGSTVAIEQGYEMKRPSILHVRVHGEEVQLSGRGVTVVDGRVRIE